MPAGPDQKQAPRGRGRPRTVRPAEVAEPEPPKKKRGRKPGSLSKKTLAIQKRKNSRALKKAAELPIVKDAAADPPPVARPRQILVMLLLALPLPPDLGLAPKLEPVSFVEPNFEKPLFVEPELAEPKPGYLGFPLEALPPQKLKRTGPGLGRGRKPRISKSTPSPESEAEAAAAESKYVQKLETGNLESLTENSELRTPVQPLVRKRGRPPNKTKHMGVPSTPKRGKRRGESTPGSRGIKRLKISSPRKPAVLLGPTSSEPPAEEPDASDNDDYCANCGGLGIFICCDSCPKSFHLLCCDPPIREIPEDNWNCNDCRAAQGMDVKRLWNELGMFGPLLNSVHGRNPVEFRLPKRLRDGTFIDVSTGDDHQYTDALLKPELSYSKTNGGQLVGYNKNEDLDIDDLYDKKGKPHLCHRCKKAGLQRRTLVSCDYCPLKWHLDCLSEPVALAKTLGLKWRCPNHVESLLPPTWLENRHFKDTTVIDAALHSHFLKLLHSSNFLIKHEDQPYISDVRQPLLQEYLQYQKDDFVTKNSAFVEKAKRQPPNGSDSENEDDIDANFKVPEYFQNYAIDGRVVAKGSRRSAKVLLMTNADDPDQKPFIYRVPERQILLDFLSTRNSKNQILKEIQNYEDLSTREMLQESEVIEGLEQLLQAPVVDERPKLNFDELVTVANSALITKPTEKASEPPANNKANGSINGAEGNAKVAKPTGAKRGRKPSIKVSKEEINELRQIKKLMELKGRDSLLSFLLS